MFVYNTTIKVAWPIANEWLNWVREEYSKEIVSTKLFDSCKIYRLLEQDDHDGPTFVIQYFTSTEEKYKKYIDEFGEAMRKKAIDKWGDQFIAHRTTMQLVN